MRDPRHPQWPDAGERTELEDVALAWVPAYHEWVKSEDRERLLGKRPPRPLDAQIEAYLAHRRGAVEPETLKGDTMALGHLRDDFGTTLVERVEPQRTIDRLLRAGKARSTVRVYSARIGAFWSWLGLAYSVRLPKVQPPEARAWLDSEIARAREAAERVGLLLPLDCGLFMGLRHREVYGLEWEDVDLATHAVRVRRQYPDAPLKGKRARTALILPGWEHLPSTGRVCSQDGIRAQSDALKQALGGLVRAGERWHIARHSYSRRFLERVPDIFLLQKSLGHASVTQTQSTYGHMVPDRAQELARSRAYG
jgi:integrase